MNSFFPDAHSVVCTLSESVDVTDSVTSVFSIRIGKDSGS